MTDQTDLSAWEKQRFVDQFLSWDIDVEYVRLAKLDVLRRPTLDERYEVARAWTDRWLEMMRRLNRTMHSTLDAITPLPRSRPIKGETPEQFDQATRR